MQTNLEPSVEIVREIANREGVDPCDLETPLYDVLDPEALDSLVAHAGSDRENANPNVEFSYLGYRVTIQSPGSVHVADEPNVQTGDIQAAESTTDD